MKTYIVRRGCPDFVVDAPTIADALVRLWFTTGETPHPSYRVHHGRRAQGRKVSSAVAYWRLSVEMRPRLRNVIEQTSTTSQYRAFCNSIIKAGLLLEK